MAEACTNCGDPDGEAYDLLFRSEPSREIYLCETCHGALEEEFIWGQ